MNEHIIKQFSEICALNAEIEGMKILNAERLSNDLSPAYDEIEFYKKAEYIRGVLDD